MPQIRRWHHPYGRKWKGTKEPLDEGEREDWKSCLKLNIQKTKLMASGPISSWQINEETMEAETDFMFSASKITAVTAAVKLKDACSLEKKVWQT